MRGMQVIKNFSLEIHQDDKIGIIGNNGTGKTTLMKLIAGVIATRHAEDRVWPSGHDQVTFPQNRSTSWQKRLITTAFDWLRDRKGAL